MPALNQPKFIPKKPVMNVGEQSRLSRSANGEHIEPEKVEWTYEVAKVLGPQHWVQPH